MTDTIPSKTVVMDVFLLFVEFCDELVLGVPIVPVDGLVVIVPGGGILLYFYFFILS